MTEPNAIGTPDYDAAAHAQTLAADPTGSAWVAANAGSGKTKVLIDRVARLLLAGAKPAAILCITYTRAAANEMITRLFDRLGNWSVMGDDLLANELAGLEKRRAESYTPPELRRARALFAQALETPGGLRIETIHAFSARLLRRFPLEAGVPPGFRDLEEADAADLMAAAATASLMALDSLSPDQLDRLAREGGGLGASAPLSLIQSNGADLSEWTKQEDAQIRAALRERLSAPDASVADLLEKALVTDWPNADYASAIGHLRTGAKTDIKLAVTLEALANEPDLSKRWQAMTGLWSTTSGGRRARNPFTKKMPDDVGDLLSVLPPEGREITRLIWAEEQIRAAAAVERSLDLMALARPYLARYQREKQALGALDFDDLIGQARGLLTRAGLSQWVLYKLDGELEHVLLDEAQDTSPMQWDLLNALTEDFFAGASAHEERAEAPRTLFVVGDEKQSIYSFQGADERAFLDGKRAFLEKTRHRAAAPDMNMSFRSSPEVLSFVDTLFSMPELDIGLTSRAPPDLSDLPRHTAFRSGQAGCVELMPMTPPPDVAEAMPWDAPVDTERESSPTAALARTIARAVRDMVDRGEVVWTDGGKTRRAITPGDVLILVRGRRSGLFDGLIRALKDQKLPVAGADRLVLSDHIGVQDCLNLIRFVVFPEDDLTVAEILRGPFCGLVDDDHHLFPLAHDRGDHSLWQRLQASDNAEFAAARAFLDAVWAARDRPAFEFLSMILNEPICDGATGWERINARLGSPARDPIEALLARGLLQDQSEGASLRRFLAGMETDASDIKRDLAKAGGAVRVMTVHGAKGLQAPVVILPDTTAGPKAVGASLLNVDGFPVWAPRKSDDSEVLEAARQGVADRSLAEERRLLYVALTRAEDRLIIAGVWRRQQKETGFHPSSWYALCASAMAKLAGADHAPDSIIRHGGAPQTAPKPDEQASGATAPPAWLHAPALIEVDRQQTISPSRLFSDGATVIDPLAKTGPDRRTRGRVIHTLLERLPRLPEADWQATARLYLSRFDDLSAGVRTEIEATVLKTLADPAMARIFAPPSRAEVEIVGQGTGLLAGRTISGRIDRLLVKAGEVLIIDIKTDQPPPREESGVDRSYLAQMAAYQNALAPAYPDRPVRCAILWTDGPRLMPISEAGLLAALNSSLSGV